MKDYDFKPKKWGHLRTIVATSGYHYPEVENIFMNISKIFHGATLGKIYFQFMTKTELLSLFMGLEVYDSVTILLKFDLGNPKE